VNKINYLLQASHLEWKPLVKHFVASSSSYTQKYNAIQIVLLSWLDREVRKDERESKWVWLHISQKRDRNSDRTPPSERILRIRTFLVDKIKMFRRRDWKLLSYLFLITVFYNTSYYTICIST